MVDTRSSAGKLTNPLPFDYSPKRTNLGNLNCPFLGPNSSSQLFDKENQENTGNDNIYSSDTSTTGSSDNESQVNSYSSDISTTGSCDNKSQVGDYSFSTGSSGGDSVSNSSDGEQTPIGVTSTQVNEAMLFNNNLNPVKVEPHDIELEKVGDEDSLSTDSGDNEQDPNVATVSTQPPKLIINPPVKHEDEKEDNSDVGDIDLVDHTINPSISVDRLADGEEKDDSYDTESKNAMPEKRDAVDEDNLTSDNASGDDSSCLPSTVQSYTEKSDEELVAPESNIVTSSDALPFNAVDIHAFIQATLPPTPSSSKTQQPIEGVSEQPVNNKEGCASLANTTDLFGTPFSDNEVSSHIQKRNKDHSFASSYESLENKSTSKLSLGDVSLNLDGTNFFENYKYRGALSPLSDVSQDDNADKSGVRALLAAKDNTIASQDNALVNMKFKLSESRRQAEYFQKEYERMKLQLAQSDTANAILQAENKERTKEVDSLQATHSDENTRRQLLLGISNHGQAAKEAEIEGLQLQSNTLNVENATLKDDNNNLKEEVESLKSAINGLTSEKTLLKEELETAQVVSAKLAKEKARVEGQVVALEKDNSVLVTANAQLEKQLTTAKQEITSLHESNEVLRGEISYAKTEHAAVKQDREDLIVSSGEKTRIIASLKNELANANDNNNALSEEVKNLKHIVEVLTSNNTRLNEESDATKAQFVSLKNDNAKLAEEKENLKERVDTLEDEKIVFVAANISNYDQANKLSCQKKDLESKLHNAQLRNEELEDKIVQKDIDIDKTTIQLEQVREALSEEVMEKHKLKKEADQREQFLLQGLKRLQN